jgi:hypothetical protein
VKYGNNRFGSGHRENHEKKVGDTEHKCEQMDAAVCAIEWIGIMPENLEKMIITAHWTWASHLVC